VDVGGAINHLEKYEMMDFVNGVGMTPLIYESWKIKILFETTNQVYRL